MSIIYELSTNQNLQQNDYNLVREIQYDAHQNQQNVYQLPWNDPICLQILRKFIGLYNKSTQLHQLKYPIVLYIR